MSKCLSCQQHVSTRFREQQIRSFVSRHVPVSRFPLVYSLVDQIDLCAKCIAELPMIEGEICKHCGRNTYSNDEESQSGLCRDCILYDDDQFVKNRSLFHYNAWTKEMISRYKYKGDERFSRLFAVMLYIVYCRFYGRQSFVGVTFVPLHQQRLVERGFNQAEVLAHELAGQLKLNVLPLLIRTKMTTKLSQQSGRARRQSMADAFIPINPSSTPPSAPLPRRIAQLFRSPQSELRLLLIDDIYTTGSTIRSCARIIKTIPVYSHAQIYSLTIAR